MKQYGFIHGLLRIVAAGALVFGVLFFSHTALADTGNPTNNATSSIYNYRWGQYLGTHLTGTVSDIEVKVGKPAQAGGGGRGTVIVKLCEWDTEVDALGSNDCTGANELVNGQWTNVTNDVVLSEADYSSGDFPVTMDPAKFYTLYVNGNSNGGLTIWGSSDSFAWRTQVENVNPGGAESTNNSATGYTPPDGLTSLNQGTDSAMRDIYFVLVGTAQTNARVTMYFPGLATASTTPDGIPPFDKFGVSLTDFQPAGHAQVHWSRSTTTLLYGNSSVVGQNGGLASTTWISLGGLVLSPGRWYANAQYAYQNDYVSSDIIPFDIATSSLAQPPVFPGSQCTISQTGCSGAYTNLPPTPANCVVVDGIETCTYNDIPPPTGCIPEVECFSEDVLSTENLSCALKNTGRAMGRLFFCPLPALQTTLTNSFNKFTGIFPANVFFGLNTTLRNAASSTPGSAELKTGTIWGQQFTIIGSSTLSHVVGQTWKDNIFTAITSLVWVVVGGVIYFTII